MTDMIERVERALHEARDYSPEGKARAVVEAIRKPLAAAMCPYCQDEWPVDGEGWHTGPKDRGSILLPDGHCIAGPVHEAIDEALK